MTSKQDSPMKKFLRQVGNIVAVQAVAGAATELGKTMWPKVKERFNAILDKADEMHQAKETRKDLRDLVKNSAMHYKKTKESRQTPIVVQPEVEVDVDPETPETPVDPPVDAKFVP